MVHKKEAILKIMITKEQRDEYKKWCKEHGFRMSKRIREFMANEIKDK